MHGIKKSVFTLNVTDSVYMFDEMMVGAALMNRSLGFRYHHCYSFSQYCKNTKKVGEREREERMGMRTFDVLKLSCPGH